MPVTKDFNWILSDFNEVLEYVADAVGSDFIRCVNLANAIIEDPKEYVGMHAAKTAALLAAYRLKIGTAHQYSKLKAAQTKHPADRLFNSALGVMYDALLELINTLKLLARHEQVILT